jgi:ABC-type transporter MlaC component
LIGKLENRVRPVLDAVYEKKGSAVVPRILRIGSETYHLEFVLQQREAGAQIVDVVVEDVSFLRNYRSFCTKIIRTQSFAALLRRFDTAFERLSKPE